MLLGLLAAGALLAAWLAGSFGARGSATLGGGEPVVVGAGEEGPAPSVDSSVPARAAADGERSASKSTIDEAPAATAGPAGRELRLRVLERESRRPLSGFLLELRQGETRWELPTDANGILVTPAVWQAGRVSAWHEPTPERAEYRARWSVEPWQVELADDDPDAEHVLFARAPALVLEVDALSADGRGVDRAQVTLVYGWRDETGAFHSESVDGEFTDASGRARIAIRDAEAVSTAVYLLANQPLRGLASELLFLDPPLSPGPWRLDLKPTGSVLLRAFGHDGQPLTAGRVHATYAQTVEAAMTVAHARIEGGTARLQRLAPAPHRLRVYDAETGDVRRLDVVVAPGRETVVDVRFDDGRTELAAEGRVLDEKGDPLEGVHVWLQAPGSGEQLVRTGSDGVFRFWSAPCGFVTVGTAADLTNDSFDPSSARVRFGTREIVLRRARVLPTSAVSFEVTGPEGRPPEDGGVQLWVGEPHALGGWEWVDLVAGRATVELKLHARVEFQVRCPGYVERRGRIEPPRQDEGLAPIRLTLERGFDWELRVIDALTSAPLEGARLAEPGGQLSGATAADGRVRLRAVAWPARLRVTRAGYRERVVDPLDLGLVGGRVELEPLEGGR